MGQPQYFFPQTNSKQVSVQFFENYPLDHAKSKLWELLKAAMENEQFVVDEKPSNTIYFYECLCDLLTAVHSTIAKT